MASAIFSILKSIINLKTHTITSERMEARRAEHREAALQEMGRIRIDLKDAQRLLQDKPGHIPSMEYFIKDIGTAFRRSDHVDDKTYYAERRKRAGAWWVSKEGGLEIPNDTTCGIDFEKGALYVPTRKLELEEKALVLGQKEPFIVIVHNFEEYVPRRLTIVSGPEYRGIDAMVLMHVPEGHNDRQALEALLSSSARSTFL